MTVIADAPAPTDDRRLGQRELLAFFGMALGMFLAVLNIQIVGSSFDEIRAGLAAGPEEVSWVLTAALIAEVIMIPMSGWLSRMVSTRWLFTACTLGFAIASLACASAWNIESMIVFRSAQGFCGGAMAPMVFATVYIAFPRRYQNHLIAIVSLLGTGAVALGPSVGGWISEALSWHWLFLISVPFALLSCLLVVSLVDFDRPDWTLAKRIDMPGIMLMAMFFMCLLIVLEEGRREDWFESRMIVTLSVITATSGILLIWRELACADPVIDLRVFTNRNFVVGAFYIMVFGAGLFVPLYLLPLFLSRIIGLNTAQIGSMLFVLGLAMMISGFFMPFLMRWFSLRAIATTGFAILALGTWYQAQLNVDTGFVELLLPQILRGFATQLCFLSMVGLAIGLLPLDQVKNGTALFQLTMRLGAAVAVAIANSYLVVRTQLHYHEIREMVSIGQPSAAATLDILGSTAPTAPGASSAAIQRLIQLSEREALIHAFNEITTVAAIGLVLSLALMPLVRGRPKP
ncbi:MAG: DHA2 family efflux MFS transporter permease subunit [Alphaproteobacteria bacterium]|jgi:DHA2 family multidrug resistance protein|nr:DHA2 family efflux MFS transporter permease subunit [Alphaproteobacteria bacterium]